MVWDVPLSNPQNTEGDTSAAQGTADAWGNKHPLSQTDIETCLCPVRQTSCLKQKQPEWWSIVLQPALHGCQPPSAAPLPAHHASKEGSSCADSCCRGSQAGMGWEEPEMLQTKKSPYTQSSFPRPPEFTLTWDGSGPQQLPSPV